MICKSIQLTALYLLLKYFLKEIKIGILKVFIQYSIDIELITELSQILYECIQNEFLKL